MFINMGRCRGVVRGFVKLKEAVSRMLAALILPSMDACC